MGEVVTYRSPRAKDESTAFVGMVVFLASWAMLFAAMFFAYGVVRMRARSWPPLDLPPLPLRLPALNTLVLAGSSVALQYAVSSVRRGRARILTVSLGTSLILGTTFLALQALVWRDLYVQGLTPRGGPYPSVFFGLTGFHAIHVAVGLVALTWLTWRSFGGAYSAAKFLPVRLWAMYWHFVGAVWGVMFLTLFVL
jgi:cytochrome c oxidase subunit III